MLGLQFNRAARAKSFGAAMSNLMAGLAGAPEGEWCLLEYSVVRN